MKETRKLKNTVQERFKADSDVFWNVNLCPYLGNMYISLNYTEYFKFATKVFTAYMKDDSKTNIQITEKLFTSIQRWTWT